MIYGILRYPHPNSRYYESTRTLLSSEFQILMNASGETYEVLGYKMIGGVELFCFSLEAELKDRTRKILHRISSLHIVFEIDDESRLVPLNEGRSSYFKDDMASILKYSGKTNEEFTAMMINLGVFSSAYADKFDTPLTVFDPMCGRGTTLYKSLIMGYNASGIDIDKSDISEINQYMKRYLKYHMYKHESEHQTINMFGEHKGTKYTITTADTKENYKAKDVRVIQFAQGDSRESNCFFRKEQFHIFVTDLPYGVQHSSASATKFVDIIELLKDSASEWYLLLKKGGAGVIAYNTHHIGRAVISEVFKNAGFYILENSPYNEFEHWVEQAVNRDLLVVRK